MEHSERLFVSVQQSRNFFRKYCGALDIILSMVQQLFGRLQVCCINRQPYQAVQALKAHKSQYVWYDDGATVKLLQRLLLDKHKEGNRLGS